jgi:hypothetical protein
LSDSDLHEDNPIFMIQAGKRFSIMDFIFVLRLEMALTAEPSASRVWVSSTAQRLSRFSQDRRCAEDGDLLSHIFPGLGGYEYVQILPIWAAIPTCIFQQNGSSVAHQFRQVF